MSLSQIYTCTICGKTDFKKENGLWVHIVRLHPESISNLKKKKYPCDLCEQSFSDRPGLSRHKVKHNKNEETKAKVSEAIAREATNRTKELQQELCIVSEKFNRERELEHRNDSLKKLLSASEGELEKMKYQYYRLFTKKIHILPINSPTHLDAITEKDYRKILHSESDAPGVFL